MCGGFTNGHWRISISKRLFWRSFSTFPFTTFLTFGLKTTIWKIYINNEFLQIRRIINDTLCYTSWSLVLPSLPYNSNNFRHLKEQVLSNLWYHSCFTLSCMTDRVLGIPVPSNICNVNVSRNGGHALTNSAFWTKKNPCPSQNAPIYIWGNKKW